MLRNPPKCKVLLSTKRLTTIGSSRLEAGLGRGAWRNNSCLVSSMAPSSSSSASTFEGYEARCSLLHVENIGAMMRDQCCISMGWKGCIAMGWKGQTFDCVAALVTLCIGPFTRMLANRRSSMPITRRVLDYIGVSYIQHHYYEPIVLPEWHSSANRLPSKPRHGGATRAWAWAWGSSRFRKGSNCLKIEAAAIACPAGSQ